MSAFEGHEFLKAKSTIKEIAVERATPEVARRYHDVQEHTATYFRDKKIDNIKYDIQIIEGGHTMSPNNESVRVILKNIETGEQLEANTLDAYEPESFKKWLDDTVARYAKK